MRAGRAYYNENDPHAAAWLRQLIAAGLIAPGDVDERDIRTVSASDFAGYDQHHFFAGIGGWSLACRLAGWPDNRPIWTGSCPCQPFSTAGAGRGADDPRHLWPDFFRLIRAARPPVVVGEQVAGKAGYGWFDGVRADLAGEDYACRGVDFAACAVDAPHQRNRLWWLAVAHRDRVGPRRRAKQSQGDLIDWIEAGREESAGWSGLRHGGVRPVEQGALADARQRALTERTWGPGWSRGEWPAERGGLARAGAGRGQRQRPNRTFWSDGAWIDCADGRSRRAEPGISLLADGVSERVAKWRGLGNAIVPQAAQEVVGALMDCDWEGGPL